MNNPDPHYYYEAIDKGEQPTLPQVRAARIPAPEETPMTEIKPVAARMISYPATCEDLAQLSATLTNKLNEAITLINAQQKELEQLRGHVHDTGKTDDNGVACTGTPLLKGTTHGI